METVIRVTLLYVVVLVGLRVMGKRELSQLAPSEFVALLLVSEIAQNALIREDYSITNAIVGMATLFSIVFLISLLSYKSKRANQVLEGSPTVLVKNGKFLTEALDKERIPPDEIYAEMHKQGLSEVKEIRWAILETDGKISFVPTEAAALTKKNDDEQAPD